MLETGIDIEEISRFRGALSNRELLKNVFSEREVDYCRAKPNPERHLAARFCAKEAVIKATGTKAGFSQIELLNDKSGKPFICIKGRRSKKIRCSISHSEKYAVALVIWEHGRE